MKRAAGKHILAWLLTLSMVFGMLPDFALIPGLQLQVKAAESGAFQVGSSTYATWDEAVTAAGSTGTIVVESNYSFPVRSEPYTVPAGVTLLLPYTPGNRTVGGASADHPYANENLFHDDDSGQGLWGKNPDSDPASYQVQYTVTVPSGVTLEVNGKLVVGGTIVSDPNSLWSGGSYGPHANLEVNGAVDLKSNSILAVTGYVLGSGIVKATGSGAKIYEPMAVEFRGGGHTGAVANALTAHSGEKLSPFFQWNIECIRTNVEIKANNSVYAYVDMYAGGHNCTAPCILGSSTGLIRLTSGKLSSSYDAAKHPSAANAAYIGRKELVFDGTASLTSMSLNVVGMSISTSQFNFPDRKSVV